MVAERDADLVLLERIKALEARARDVVGEEALGRAMMRAMLDTVENEPQGTRVGDPGGIAMSRNDEEIEADGATWATRSDAYLVGYVADTRGVHFHSPAIVEMQRRQMVATRDFNRQSTRLTLVIIGLTVALGVIAGLQLVAFFAERG